MGGFFGATLKRDCIEDVFYGVDYHSHLGTSRGGMISYDDENGYVKQIHNISSTPFRAKFEHDLAKFHGKSAIAAISDSDPQPLLVKSHLGLFALSTVGAITNADKLIEDILGTCGTQFMAMSSGGVNITELVGALINQKETLIEGIQFAQDVIEGSITILILKENEMIAARDKFGRLPILIGKNEYGYVVSFESFAYQKLGYQTYKELGPGEICSITKDKVETLVPPGDTEKICSFLWVYYGYPNSNYDGVNVEVMRYRNGSIMARDEAKRGPLPHLDWVAGVPDSGVPHAIGFSNEAKLPFERPFIKYTPTWLRSFMPTMQGERNKVAKMKQIPVFELIENQRLLFVDDSIVRGTQLRETIDFLYKCGAEEIHIRSACPPIMYGCKYLTFSRSTSEMELIARRVIQELEGDEGQKHLEEYADIASKRGQCLVNTICEEMGFSSLGFQSLEGLIEAIGLPKERICTYCFNGKE